jgi:hypothetical protein
MTGARAAAGRHLPSKAARMEARDMNTEETTHHG